MKYILIYIIMTAEYGTASVVQEFDNEPACEFAMRAVAPQAKFLIEKENVRPITFVTCIPKGGPGK